MITRTKAFDNMENIRLAICPLLSGKFSGTVQYGKPYGDSHSEQFFIKRWFGYEHLASVKTTDPLTFKTNRMDVAEILNKAGYDVTLDIYAF
jgi:hypothetical protein